MATTPSPLIFLLGELDGETHHFLIDPITATSKRMVMPELEAHVECLSAKFGWLLLISRDTCSLFFFNPLTRERIDLPYRGSTFSAVAFSAAPTSPLCTVYAVTAPSFIGKLCVDTFCLSQKDRRWERHEFKPTERESNVVLQAVCHGGDLYCVDSHGRVSVFDTKTNSWCRFSSAKDKAFGRICSPYLFELNGDLYAEKTGIHGAVEKKYRLIVENGVAEWVEVVEDAIDGTLFCGPYGSLAVPFSVRGSQKNIYVARDGPDEARCVVYGFEDGDFAEGKKMIAPNNGRCFAHIP